VVLRADQQTLQTQPTVTLPQNLVDRAKNDTPFGEQGPNLTIGTIPKVGRPKVTAKPSSDSNTNNTSNTGGGSNGGGNNGTTATTTPSESPTTTTPPVTANAFAQGRIAYSAGGTLWSINPDGSDRRGLGVSGFFPAWAKDHSALAYADADNPGGALYLLSPNGTKVGLTTGVVDDAQPTWSPDGTKLAFARYDTTADTDKSAIWLVNRDGTNKHKIATPSPCFSRDPAWSPDGKKIAFWSSRDHCTAGPTQGNYELYLYDVTTDTTTRLSPNHANAGAPAWSPNSKRIAFACDGEGGLGFEICLINADGTGSIDRITNVSGDDTDPAWSPDGARIAFRSDRNEGGIFTMKADGSDVKLLVAGGTQPNWN
jgi:Tol biopolymer transport system component